MTNTSTQTAKKSGPARKTADSASAMADRVKTQVGEGLTQSQDVLQDVATQATDEMRKVSDESARFVRENPGIAVAGAVGVGVLIGMALRAKA